MEITNSFSRTASAGKYDVQGALSEGYTLEDIGKDAGFDVAGAKSEGYTDEEIMAHLQGDSAQAQEGEVSVGDLQVIQLSNNQNVDTKTTTPMQSMPIAGKPSDEASVLVSTDFPEYSKDQVMQAIVEHRNATQDYYVDPVTGDTKVSTRISGAIEPAYDMLPGGGSKLGIFGIEAAIAAGKVTPEVVQGVNEAFAAVRPGLQDMAFDKSISPAAKLLLARRIDISDDEAIKILQGIPTNEQALTLARALGEHGYIKQAVKAEGDKEAGQLLNIIKSPSGEVKTIVGEPDIQAAKDKYSAMSASISSEGTSNVRPVPKVSAKLNQLLSETYLVPNSAQSVALRLKGAIDRNNGNLSLPDAVDYMPELNSLIMKARNHNERAALQDIKSTIDDTITKLATPEQRSMFDDAVNTYARTMQNKETLDIINANTKEGIGTNWTKVHRELAEANLRSPEAVDALRVAEAFATKYGNDSKLVQTARAAGSSPDSGGALGAYGFLVNHLKDIFANAGMKVGIETNRGINLKIQKDIIKAIRQGKTDSEFVQNIRNSRNIPDEVKEQIVDVFEPKQITYNPEAR